MNQRVDQDPAVVLKQLGFTESEAHAYCALLANPCVTGYRLAQELGKAPTNIYRSLAGLEARGAVVVEDDDARTYRAVPPFELMSRLNREFMQRTAGAAAALDRLSSSQQDQRIYQMRDVEQAVERALMMIGEAKEVVLFDLFPGPYAWLREHLDSATSRGVVVAGKVYTGQSEARIQAVQSSSGLAASWPGQQMTLIVDASEYLLTLVGRDDKSLLQGYWSSNAYLACIHHNGLACELAVTASSSHGAFADLSLLALRPPGLRSLAT